MHEMFVYFTPDLRLLYEMFVYFTPDMILCMKCLSTLPLIYVCIVIVHIMLLASIFFYLGY